jgi:hypothetical protein
MQVLPFYSLMRGIAIEDLWHDNDECPIGLSIALADRLKGTNHILKHCPYCTLLTRPTVANKVGA